MAENLQFLRRRIKTASNIAQIAKAMEMISASKIKKAQSAVENNKPYSEKIKTTLDKVISSIDLEKFKNPYLRKNTSQKKLFIVFSPDKGLAGALTTNLMKKIMTIENENNYYVTVGKKIDNFVSKLKGELIASFPMSTALPTYSMIFPILEIINEYYLQNKTSEVNIVLTQFNSIFFQIPEIIKILPIDLTCNQTEQIKEIPYVFEPNPEIILDELLPYFLEVQIYQYLIQAFTSEQAARMVAMQNAKNNALDIAEFLTLSYNKARQARITNELLDLANIHFT